MDLPRAVSINAFYDLSSPLYCSVLTTGWNYTSKEDRLILIRPDLLRLWLVGFVGCVLYAWVILSAHILVLVTSVFSSVCAVVVLWALFKLILTEEEGLRCIPLSVCAILGLWIGSSWSITGGMTGEKYFLNEENINDMLSPQFWACNSALDAFMESSVLSPLYLILCSSLSFPQSQSWGTTTGKWSLLQFMISPLIKLFSI